VDENAVAAKFYQLVAQPMQGVCRSNQTAGFKGTLSRKSFLDYPFKSKIGSKK
jgi:hypothetical protein